MREEQTNSWKKFQTILSILIDNYKILLSIPVLTIHNTTLMNEGQLLKMSHKTLSNLHLHREELLIIQF